MKCERYEEELTLLAGGELEEARAEEVRRHVAECKRCREEVERYRADRGVLGSVGGTPKGSDEEFAEEVAGRFAAMGMHHRWGVRHWVGVGLKAAAVVLVAGALVLWGRTWREESGGKGENGNKNVASHDTGTKTAATTQYEVSRVNGRYLYNLSFPVEGTGEFTDTGRVKQSGPMWHVERVVYTDDYSDSY